MPVIPKELHEDTVSTAYGLLVNICTVFYLIPAIAPFFTVRQPHSGPDLITIEASLSQADTHTHKHSVELLWTSDQPSQTTLPGNTQHLQQTDIHAPGGI